MFPALVEGLKVAELGGFGVLWGPLPVARPPIQILALGEGRPLPSIAERVSGWLAQLFRGVGPYGGRRSRTRTHRGPWEPTSPPPADTPGRRRLVTQSIGTNVGPGPALCGPRSPLVSEPPLSESDQLQRGLLHPQDGPLNLDAFRRSFNEIVRRHPGVAHHIRHREGRADPGPSAPAAFRPPGHRPQPPRHGGGRAPGRRHRRGGVQGPLRPASRAAPCDRA